MSGAVGRIARASNRCFTVVAGVATKPALVYFAVGRAVERESHVLEVDNRVDGFARENLGGVLIDEVVTAFDGVERVPFPRVLFDVGQRGGHSALRRTRVRPRWVQLGDDGGFGVGGGFDGRAHARTTRSNNDDVVLVMMNRGHGLCSLEGWCQPALQNEGRRLSGAPAGHGSRVKTTSVPRVMRTAAETTSEACNTFLSRGRVT